VAEDAVRSKTVSARLFPAICDLQGDFQKLQGEPVHWLSNLPMLSSVWREFSLLSEQRAFFRIAGKSSEGLRMVAGSVSQIPLRQSLAPQRGGVWSPMRGVGIPTFARPGDCVPSLWE
jgi:hypothetical protein